MYVPSFSLRWQERQVICRIGSRGRYVFWLDGADGKWPIIEVLFWSCGKNPEGKCEINACVNLDLTSEFLGTQDLSPDACWCHVSESSSFNSDSLELPNVSTSRFNCKSLDRATAIAATFFAKWNPKPVATGCLISVVSVSGFSSPSCSGSAPPVSAGLTIVSPFSGSMSTSVSFFLNVAGFKLPWSQDNLSLLCKVSLFPCGFEIRSSEISSGIEIDSHWHSSARSGKRSHASLAAVSTSSTWSVAAHRFSALSSMGSPAMRRLARSSRLCVNAKAQSQSEMPTFQEIKTSCLSFCVVFCMSARTYLPFSVFCCDDRLQLVQNSFCLLLLAFFQLLKTAQGGLCKKNHFGTRKLLICFLFATKSNWPFLPEIIYLLLWSLRLPFLCRRCTLRRPDMIHTSQNRSKN